MALKPIREEKTFEVLDLVSPSLVLRGEGVLSDELYELPLIAKSFLSEIYSGRKYYSLIRPTPDGQYNEYVAFLDNATRVYFTLDGYFTRVQYGDFNDEGIFSSFPRRTLGGTGYSAIDSHDGNLTHLVKISGKVDTPSRGSMR